MTTLRWAAVAGPPSPEKPGFPVPATVVTSPERSTLTTMEFPPFPPPTYRLPSASRVIPKGDWRSTRLASPGAGEAPSVGGPTTVVI